MSLTNLEQFVNQLNPQTQEKFRRIFEVSQETGRLRIPEPMRDWVKTTFGDSGKIEQQIIVRVTNKVTQRGASFNPLRAQRPEQTRGINATLEELIQKTEGDPFCQPEQMTPEDTFGRVRGAYCLTAANVAKAEAWHGVLVFRKHHPLDWNQDELVDFLATANQWFYRVHQEDDKAVYPFLLWNCLWRAAASIVHGHMQMLVSHSPFAQVVLLSQQAQEYQAQYQANYFDELYQVHSALDLTLPTNYPETRAFVSLCPTKEREVVIIGDKFDQNLWSAFADIMVAYRNKLNIKTFNIGVTLPPLDGITQNLPVVIQIIERGDLASTNSDIGALERFAQEIITYDPFETRRILVG